MLSLSFGGAAEAVLIDAINNGTDFQLIVTATDSTHDLTYSGVGNTFDPGDPNLKITVPEPTALVLLLSGLFALLRRR